MKKCRNAYWLMFVTFAVLLLYGAQILYTKQHYDVEIAVLGYHHIVPDEDKELYYKDNMWVNSLSSFEEQMKLLHEEGYHTISLDEFYEWKQGYRELDDKSIVITFDDGFYSSICFASPILQKYGFEGNVFVIGSQIDNDHGPYDPSRRQHASLTDMEDTSVLHYYSHSYDLHQKDHYFYGYKVDNLTKEELRLDVLNAAKQISTTYYAYPFGRYNSVIQEVLKEEHTKLAFSFNENRKVRRADDNYAIPRFCINAYTRLDVFLQMISS